MSALLIYRAITAAAAPAVRRYLERRCAAGKEDKARLGERFGIAARARPAGPLVWIHGASVGEAVSVLALIDRLLADRPKLNVLVTTGTVTSARLLAQRLTGNSFHQYVPVDRAAWVRRFLAHWRPDLMLCVESELWPNMIVETDRAGVPMVLVNGRMSDASFMRWKRFPFLVRPLLARFRLCLGQDDGQAARLGALGARAVRSPGNLKYAAPPLPYDERELKRLSATLAGRPLWLAASTHSGEEAMAGAAHRALARRHANLLTVVVPRHPGRGPAVAEELRAAGLRVARRAAGEPPAGAEVYVADTLGELGLFYRLVPVVFVGGSLVPHGGQNPLEPALLGTALVLGPHTGNFASVVAELRAADAALEVESADGLARAVGMLLAEPERRAALGAAARGVAEARRGVLDAVVRELAPFLDRVAPASAGATLGFRARP